MRADDVLVRVDDLSVAYGDTTVVDQVSFEVPAGSTTALVGESGSGKTTVARTLLGHLRAGARLTSGRVSVGGRDVFGLDRAGLRRLRSTTVAMVPQNAGHALTPSMRVGRQVEEALLAAGADRAAARERTVETFAQVSLPDPDRIGRRYPHQLSGGQQQRVAIALAVAVRPKVLVLDEPTTGLDVITQRAILGLLRELTLRLGTATVMVSHDFGVVAALADHATVLRAGRAVESAPAKQLFQEPGDEYTRELLGAVPRIGGAVSRNGADQSQRGESPRGESLLRVQDVRIGYGHRERDLAVRGASFELRRGEVVALVGESGSGKSTLAWSLAGLHGPRDGSMRYLPATGDGDLAQAARRRPLELRRRIQLVFQNADTSLNPRRVVAEAVRRPLRLFRGLRGSELAAREAELARDVRLEPELLRRLPMQLSGGQRQRVGIARALAGSPAVMVADEITTALDVSVQASILDLLEQLRGEHDLACLFISHDLGVVKRIADRLLVMHGGVVVEEGPADAVFDGPNHPYTRELIEATLEPDPELARASVRPEAGGDIRESLSAGRLTGLRHDATDPGVGASTGAVVWRWRDAGPEMVELGDGHRVRQWELTSER
ncbi:ABC transporter ATP-binding protein [Phytoactinopolyspora halotolerans]|uniref:ABC transporter ATP-binding protein n=1 Tax=Phytoactinopolyspora halotolerans TaxID=1981512 RepID=A0A6L9SAH9_9ACTN|nr:ABC transporter ATP-binding protein [Phytoactinopolyspora halotolerans]NEE01621.1 ABC transporter ATP-binding protein [Phytoactinopolyspora halotolerans]